MTDQLSDTLMRRIQKEQEAMNGDRSPPQGNKQQPQQPNRTYPSLSTSGEPSKTNSDESLDDNDGPGMARKLEKLPTPPPDYGTAEEQRRRWANGGLNHGFRNPRLIDPDFEGKITR